MTVVSPILLYRLEQDYVEGVTAEDHEKLGMVDFLDRCVHVSNVDNILSVPVAEGDDGAVAREEGNVPVQLVSSGDDDSDDEDDDDNPDDGGDDRPDDGPDDGGDDRPDDGPDGEDDRPDGGPDDDPDDDDRKDDDRDDRDDRKEDDRNDDKAKDDNVEYGKPSEPTERVPNWFLHILCACS